MLPYEAVVLGAESSILGKRSLELTEHCAV
jgi:hypothetical protein